MSSLPYPATAVRRGQIGDLPYIESLRRKERDALGFIPFDSFEAALGKRTGTNTMRHAVIFVSVDNDDLTGYIFASFGKPVAKILQVVVQEDARRWERATRLVMQIESIAKERSHIAIRARVAVDIDANAFWKASGFTPIDFAPGTFLGRDAKNGRLLIVYEKNLTPTLFTEVA